MTLRKPSAWKPWHVYTYDVAWIVALLALALAYAVQPAWEHVPHWEFAFQNVVPLWVPWAGGLGGATISLVGVATHTHEWKALQYGYWHISRPFLGAVCGTVAVLIVVLVLRSVDPPANGQVYTPGGVGVLAVIAFVVGYREETFRELVTRVVDVLLASGPNPASPVAAVPTILDFGTCEVGVAVVKEVTLVNAGRDVVHIAAGAAVIAPAKYRDAVKASVSETDLTPDSTVKVTVTWTPDQGQDLIGATLVIETESRTLTCPMKGKVQR